MGHPQYERTITDNSPTIQVAESGWQPPYLPRALLEAPIGLHSWSQTSLEKEILAGTSEPVKLDSHADFDKDLARLLGHIDERLKLGVLEAWCSDSGYGDMPEEVKAIYEGPGTAAEKLDKYLLSLVGYHNYFSHPEEVWARALSEMISFLPYAGVLPIYGDQKRVYEKFPDGAYPIVLACQDVCSVCILSRGFTWADLSKVIDKTEYGGCSCTAGSVDYPAFKGVKKEPGGVDYSLVKNLVTLENHSGEPLPPGSIIVFNPDGVEARDQSGNSHIMSVLRLFGNRVQFLETSPANEGHRFFGDHPGDTVPHGSDWVAVGLASKPPVDLIECASRMARSRPLGYARIAVFDTTTADPTPRFVSKLFHMRHHLSHWVWAMRNLPVRGLRVVANFYVPKGTINTDPLLAEDGLVKPPSELFPRSGAELEHVAAIVGEGGDACVARQRIAKLNGKPQTTWYENFYTPGAADFAVPLAAKFGMEKKGTIQQKTTSVWAFCISPRYADQRYVCRPPALDAAGKPVPSKERLDKNPTGVALFDP